MRRAGTRRPAVLLAALALLATAVPRASADEPLRVTPHEILVLGAPSASKGGAAAVDAPEALRELVRARGVRVIDVTPLSANPGALDGGAWVLRLDDTVDPAEAAGRLLEDPRVRYAGPNHLVRIAAVAPDDPGFPNQTALARTRVPEAWERSLGEGVLVAVIDTGVEIDHPDLVDRIAVNVAERDGLPGVDDDGNGYVDDVFGYDFTDAPELPGIGDYTGRDPDPADDFGHGTNAAGIIAATRNNGIDIAGVAPEASILAVRAGLRTSDPLYPAVLQEDDAAAAIIYAADRGADVLNLSWGDVVSAPVIAEAVRYARARGVLVVASAGNEGGDVAFYPAGYPGVLAVGASGTTDARTAFSVFGDDLDLLAPGLSVLTLALGGGTTRVSGTSFSAPFTAGVVALVMSLHPGWTADQVAWRLKLSARRATTGWTEGAGWGALDAGRATRDDGVEPPVVVLEAPARGDAGAWTFSGTAAGESLLDWELALGGAGRDTVLARSTAQLVAAPLASWSDATWPVGESVLRLGARHGDGVPLEDRLRVHPAIETLVGEPAMRVEAAGARGWDIVVTFETSGPARCAIEVAGAEERHRAEETAAGEAHVLRLRGPLSPGAATARILARPPDAAAFRTLVASLALPELPAAPAPLALAEAGDAPAGTPYSYPVDLDGDFRPEVLVEEPPVGAFYGTVRALERTDDGGWEALPNPGGDYGGIPLGVADPDGDGRQEILVFQVGDWSVREAVTPGAFPIRNVLSMAGDPSVPVGFAIGGGVAGVAAILDDGLRFWAVGGGTYVLAGTATNDAPGTPRLLVGGAIGDFTGDARPEAAIVDAAGNLVLFALEAEGPRWLGAWPMPIPMRGPLLAVPGDGHDLVWGVGAAPDAEPGQNPFDLGATAIVSVRVAEDGAATAVGPWFAGTPPSSGLRLIRTDEGALLFRRGHIDRLVRGADGAPTWGGEVLETDGFDGMARIPLAGVEKDLLWLGSSRNEPGMLRTARRDPGPFVVGPALRIERAEVVGDSLRVTLVWDAGGCDGNPGVLRVLEDGTRRLFFPEGTRLDDRVPLGSSVTWSLRWPSCSDADVAAIALAPVVPAVAWDGPDRLEITLDRPLAAGRAPVRVATADGGALRDAAAVQILSGGRRLLASGFDFGDAPDSLVLVGAVDAAGLPVGGAWRTAFALDPRPVPAADGPVIQRVDYVVSDGAPRLDVEVDGLDVECADPFTLEPTGWNLAFASGAAAGSVALPGPLAAGRYTLRVRSECAPAGASTLGAARSFTVGLVAWPNPIRAGQSLTVSGLEPGSTLELIDVRGDAVRRWDVAGAVEVTALDGLAPGVYILRVSAAGRSAAMQRIAVLR